MSLTDSHHNHYGQNSTWVELCHGWNVPGIITVITILVCKTLADSSDVMEISRINSHKYLNMLQHNILGGYLKRILERYLNISTRCNITSREDEHEDEVNVVNRIKVI